MPLKNRRRDFLRIIPADAQLPVDKLSDKHFVARQFVMRFEKTRFPNRNIHFGITISIKSTSKLAHDRNLVKRRFRAAMNRWARKYDIIGWDFIVVARKASLKGTYKELEDDFKEAFAHLEKIKRRYRYK